MGLLYQLETELEQELPARLRQALPVARDLYQAQCPDCQLAMRRHRAYRRSIVTGYGAMALWIPVFRCGECRRMSGGADVLGADARYRRYSKKTGETALKLAALGLSYAAASGWGGGEKRTVPLAEVVSDGDRAIAAGRQMVSCKMVYGREVPHQFCHFHLLREYRRNLGWDGWTEGRRLLAPASVIRRAAVGAAGGGLDPRRPPLGRRHTLRCPQATRRSPARPADVPPVLPQQMQLASLARRRTALDQTQTHRNGRVPVADQVRRIDRPLLPSLVNHGFPTPRGPPIPWPQRRFWSITRPFPVPPAAATPAPAPAAANGTKRS